MIFSGPCNKNSRAEVLEKSEEYNFAGVVNRSITEGAEVRVGRIGKDRERLAIPDKDA